MADDRYTFAIDAEDEASDNLKQAEENVEDLGNEMDDMGDKAEKAGGQSEMFNAALAGGIAGGIADAAIEKAGELATELAAAQVEFTKNTAAIERNAQAAGASVERYQELQFAFERMGLEGDNLQEALNTVAERAFKARNGAKGMQEDFQALGISVEQLRGKSPAELFKLVTRRIGETKGATEAASGATALLGDEMATKLLPRLRENSDAFAEFARQANETGNVLDRETIAKAEKASEAWKRMSKNASGLGKQMQADMLPILEDAADLTNEIVQGAQEVNRISERGGARTESQQTQQAVESKILGSKGAKFKTGLMRRLGLARDVEPFEISQDVNALRSSLSRLFSETARGREQLAGAGGFLDQFSGAFTKANEQLSQLLQKEKQREKQRKREAERAARQRRQARKELEMLQAQTELEKARVNLEQTREEVQRKGLTGARKKVKTLKAQNRLIEAQTESQLKAIDKLHKRRMSRIKQRNRHQMQAIKDRAKARMRAVSGSRQLAQRVESGEAVPEADTTVVGEGGEEMSIDELRRRQKAQNRREKDRGGVVGVTAGAAGRGVGRAGGAAAQMVRRGGRRRAKKIKERAPQRAKHIRQQNNALARQIKLYGQLGSKVGTLTSGIAKLAKHQFKFANAQEAAVSATSALSQVSGIASKFVEGTRERAGVKAAFEAAAAIAAGAGYAASGGTAANLLAASIQHGTAASLFGAIAAGAGNVGGGGGGAGATAGGSGGGAPSTLRKPSGVNPNKMAQQSGEAFAKAMKAEQSMRPLQINVDMSNSTNLQNSPQTADQIKSAVEDVSRQQGNLANQGNLGS